MKNISWSIVGIVLIILIVLVILFVPFILFDIQEGVVKPTPIKAEEIYSLTIKVNHSEQTVCHIIHGKYDSTIQPNISCVAMCSQEGYKFSNNRFQDLEIIPWDSDSEKLQEIIDLLDLEKPVKSQVEYFEMELPEQPNGE